MGHKTLTILKQELQVYLRMVNRAIFSGLLPDVFIFADRKAQPDGRVEWYIGEASVEVAGRPSMRIPQTRLMEEQLSDEILEEALSAYIHHWQHFTGRVVQKDAEYDKKHTETKRVVAEDGGVLGEFRRIAS